VATLPAKMLIRRDPDPRLCRFDAVFSTVHHVDQRTRFENGQTPGRTSAVIKRVFRQFAEFSTLDARRLP
jgi:hypothetical protein